MNKKLLIGAAGAALVAGVAGGAVAVAAGGDDNEAPITGSALDRATKVALEHTGEGRVTETEVGDEEGFYEVEVTLDDGRQVDVHLNEDFSVIASSADRDGGDDESSDD
ncbi:MAG: hypothetical protein ACRD0U_12275 [Acidimicrobiales bacterium]